MTTPTADATLDPDRRRRVALALTACGGSRSLPRRPTAPRRRGGCGRGQAGYGSAGPSRRSGPARRTTRSSTRASAGPSTRHRPRVDVRPRRGQRLATAWRRPRRQGLRPPAESVRVGGVGQRLRRTATRRRPRPTSPSAPSRATGPVADDGTPGGPGGGDRPRLPGRGTTVGEPDPRRRPLGQHGDGQPARRWSSDSLQLLAQSLRPDDTVSVVGFDDQVDAGPAADPRRGREAHPGVASTS